MNLKKKDTPLKIDSDDTEGSDLSYESSFDEKDLQEQQGDSKQKIQLFKEQMMRFLTTNPELAEEIKFDKQNYEEDGFWGEPVNNLQKTQNNNLHQQKSDQEEQKEKPYSNLMWQTIAGNLIQENKRQSSIPSVESFTQRINLFRRKVDKPDIIEIISKNKDKLLSQIAKEEERKAKQQNKIHKTIEAKLRKETGDVAYYSLRKKFEFQFRMKQEENRQIKKVQDQAEKEKNTIEQQQNSLQPKDKEILQKQQSMQVNNKQKSPSSPGQQKKKKAKGPSVFDRLGGKNVEQETEKEPPLDMEFKTKKGEELYRLIQKKDNDEDKKRAVIQFLINHREKTQADFDGKHSLLAQGQKYYSEESKEFSLLAPNQQIKQYMKESGIIDDDFFESRSNLEDGNIYLLTKANKILNGNLMKKWKSIQDSQF